VFLAYGVDLGLGAQGRVEVIGGGPPECGGVVVVVGVAEDHGGGWGGWRGGADLHVHGVALSVLHAMVLACRFRLDGLVQRK
jgi:hypothetical protein